MKLLKILLIISSAAMASSCSHLINKEQHGGAQRYKDNQNNYNKAEGFYENIIRENNVDVAKLNLFFTRMPKGGDIHHHYTGTIYAETYLDWVEEKGWFIDKCTLKILKSNSKETELCPSLTVDELLEDNESYRTLLTLWSDKDYKNHFHIQPAPDTNFFNTFSYFGLVSDEYMNKGLSLIKKRAVKENVSYIETMLSQVGVIDSDYFSTSKISILNQELRQAKNQKEVNYVLDKISQVFKDSSQFSDAIDHFVKMVETKHNGIDDERFTMRFQTYAVRVLDPVQVFTDLYSGYLAAEKSPLVVGVNIVAPENNYIALSDYTLHMRMYNYLLNKYPDVNRALHAGELTLGMVRPKDLNFHITEAMSIAQAQRIGHGVDLPYEWNSLALLKDLKENSVIEINLTSNQFILGVEKNTHPYQIYASYGVPLIISTDDSGVSRNNLSNEYMLLSSRYKPDYSRVKKYVYNSINYSFLSTEDKKKHIGILDKEFINFEKEIAALVEEMD
jgi:adenosine deaminase